MSGKRLRVFAGPNGSGKSSIYHDVCNFDVGGQKIDMGIYVNADEIAKTLIKAPFDLTTLKLQVTKDEFISLSTKLGLITAKDLLPFSDGIAFENNALRLLNHTLRDRVAQAIAMVAIELGLALGLKMTYETVFSHPSKVELLARARAFGYKVYLYFVSTESAEINIYRVKERVKMGGHAVPPDKITSRYTRSLENLYEACQHAYQAFLWDNSIEAGDRMYFAHFKEIEGKRIWDPMHASRLPAWFIQHYLLRDHDALRAVIRD